ncbi:MAG TPA: hydroxymethylbilane synthase [Acidimicrobiales bacterium]|nr:hydroxymethylbilane synthase [Acidimicrobiales bacterium]
MEHLRLATRGSPLALRQADIVAALLRDAHPGLDVEAVVVRTRGDREAKASLDRIGGQGVFVAEVEAAVTDGRADAAVHSAKDMSSTMPAHLVLAAVPERADPRDGLVGCTLAGLAPGALVATGSARRRAQLAHLRPDLVFTDLRGNMARRVAVAEDSDVAAVVVAVAAMVRLGWEERLRDVVDPVDLLPQAGQGAIAVQCRRDDDATRALVQHIDHAPSHRALRAERAVLAALGANCALPVAAFAEADEDSAGEGGGGGTGLRVTGLLASGDGRRLVRVRRAGSDPEVVGTAVARALEKGGARAIDGFAAFEVGTGL